MKKTIFAISLCLLTFSASAQFKVQSDGKIAIQTTSTALSPISINGAGSTNYYISCDATTDKNGILINATGNNSNVVGGNYNASTYGTKAVGLNTCASVGNNSYGIISSAGCAPKAIGVCGNVQYTTLGAAIYGTTQGEYGSALTSGIYAGFFNGDVKVTGDIDGTLLGRSSGSSAGSLSLRSASVASSLSGLNVTTYQKERPVQIENTEIIDDFYGDSLLRGEAPEPNVIEEQLYEKTHYALDADRLEESFPDLVYVRKDGSKAINYMEMIPLLVQSINELNAEIEILKGQAQEGAVKAARTITSVEGTSLSNNVLYQNSPNPFKEQTTIRFSLADDVRDAAICIFDMTGKMLKKLPVSSGDSSVKVNGWELGEGMFLYTLLVNGQEIDTKRMVITK
jgi:hypothetical protein